MSLYDARKDKIMSLGDSVLKGDVTTVQAASAYLNVSTKTLRRWSKKYQSIADVWAILTNTEPLSIPTRELPENNVFVGLNESELSGFDLVETGKQLTEAFVNRAVKGVTEIKYYEEWDEEKRVWTCSKRTRTVKEDTALTIQAMSWLNQTFRERNYIDPSEIKTVELTGENEFLKPTLRDPASFSFFETIPDADMVQVREEIKQKLELEAAGVPEIVTEIEAVEKEMEL